MAIRLGISVALVAGLAAGCVAADSPDPAPSTEPATTQAAATDPSPSLSPDDVVHAVVQALRNNDEQDSGIRTTWKFASPANKQMTGPLERFIPLVKNPLYLPLLDGRLVKYGSPQVQGDQAEELVAITEVSGEKAWFVFRLARQSDGPTKGCWMTDGVIRVKAPGQNGPNPGETPSGPPV